VNESGQLAGRCSLWWQQTPPLENHRLGLIGHYCAQHADAGTELLVRACTTLTERGCTLAVGPMDGNTWQRYRLVTDRGPEPPFFLEPDNPDDWPGHFTRADFTPLAEYFSAVTDCLDTEDTRTQANGDRLRQQGIEVSTLRLDRFEEELGRIHALSCESFRDNFLYTPIVESDFMEQYRGVRTFVVPELVFLAEKAGELVGYLFGIPNILEKQRSQAIDTVIVKTMASHPRLRGCGLGGLLMARCHAAAQRLGFRRAIHALMHESNHSRRISSHSARIFRRYTLFARPLSHRP
jgi:GNAT superfamily N-acetyltransferase